MELQKVQRTTLTMKEAAEYLGISYWLINQLVSCLLYTSCSLYRCGWS